MQTRFESDVVRRPQPMVREESPEDVDAVDTLLREAFKGHEMAKQVRGQRTRSAADAAGLVAVVSDHGPGEAMAGLGHGEVVGYLRLTPTAVDDHEVLVLSPVAVSSARRRQGVGTYLVQFALEMEADGRGRTVVVPDEDRAPFWGRFGLRYRSEI